MTSFIITAYNREKRHQKALLLCNEAQIDIVDVSVFEKKDDEGKKKSKKTTQSIGIEDVKNLQKTLFLRPIKSQTKAVIIMDADTLTLEAQNALLKVLEEPPAHTMIFLLANSTESLLPTILSRCQILALQEDQKTLTDKEKTTYDELLEKLHAFTIADSLEYAEKVGKTKEDALVWLEKCIIATRDQMLTCHFEQREKSSCHSELVSGSLIQKLQQAYTKIKTTNASHRLILENLFLSYIK